MNPSPSPHRLCSPIRVWVIARNTLTQLVRQRAFYFLLVFSLVILLAAMLIQNFTDDASRQLKIMKDMSFFAMSIFCTIFAIVATSNLIPRDVEDRTLYTILAKPVPRLEYLVGKYAGGMLVIFFSLAIMTVLLYLALYARQQALMAEYLVVLNRPLSPEGREDIELILSQLKEAGPSWRLLTAVLAIGLQALVLGALTLFISTFASSGLFTVVVAFVAFFVGYIEPVVLDYWRSSAESISRLGSFVSYLVELVFPNFQTFNLVDGVVSGAALAKGTMAKILSMAMAYVGVYLLAAYFCFAEKEL